VERLGIVGLPYAGKTDLFTAITGGAGSTRRGLASHTGVAQVPDHRLDRLAEVSRSRKVVHATVEFTDIAGLEPGAVAHGIGRQVLAEVREADALVLVLRAFPDPTVPGERDPLESLRLLEFELAVADAATVDAQLAKRRKAAQADRSLASEVAALEAAAASLNEGVPLYRSPLDAEARRALRPYFLLTNKPVLAVVNIGEEQLPEAEALVKPVADELGGAEVLAVCVKLEREVAALDPSERAELLAGLGLGEGALPRVVHAAYRLIGRETFFTTGEKESRAWTFRTGSRAPECAGVIHSDMQRGFIRAEVIRWDELCALGSWQAARAAGRVRVEGKDYVVVDGDVLEIRFNV
jgi:GTP-binding protein YchF